MNTIQSIFSSPWTKGLIAAAIGGGIDAFSHGAFTWQGFAAGAAIGTVAYLKQSPIAPITPVVTPK